MLSLLKSPGIFDWRSSIRRPEGFKFFFDQFYRPAIPTQAIPLAPRKRETLHWTFERTQGQWARDASCRHDSNPILEQAFATAWGSRACIPESGATGGRRIRNRAVTCSNSRARCSRGSVSKALAARGASRDRSENCRFLYGIVENVLRLRNAAISQSRRSFHFLSTAPCRRRKWPQVRAYQALSQVDPRLADQDGNQRRRLKPRPETETFPPPDRFRLCLQISFVESKRNLGSATCAANCDSFGYAPPPWLRRPWHSPRLRRQFP